MPGNRTKTRGSNATGRRLKAVQLMLAGLRVLPEGGPGRNWTELRRTAGPGVEYDLYEPRDGARRTFILLHGLVVTGERDRRLVNFARSLARSGVRAVAAALPAMKALCLDPADLAVARDLATVLHAEYGRPLGLMGFSIGGGYALAAAADPAVAPIADLVLTMGAHYDLADVGRSVREFLARPPRTDDEWDDAVYLHLVRAFNRPGDYRLDDRQQRDLAALLEDYCHEPDIERKKSFFRSLAPDDSAGSADWPLPDADAAGPLSPAGKMDRLAARVVLLHDRFDRLVPPAHARRIHRELTAGRPDRMCKILITPLLSHVSARFAWRVHDAWRLAGSMGEIFR